MNDELRPRLTYLAAVAVVGDVAALNAIHSRAVQLLRLPNIAGENCMWFDWSATFVQFSDILQKITLFFFCFFLYKKRVVALSACQIDWWAHIVF